MKKSEPPIIVEQSYNVPIEKVWDAITDVDQMVQWFFDNIPSYKAEVRFETQFNIEHDGRNFLHLWKITEVVPYKKIVTNWQYEGYQGESLVTFELFELNNVTTFRLSSEVLEDFQEGIPEFTRENGVAGWTYFIKKSLKEYLEK